MLIQEQAYYVARSGAVNLGTNYSALRERPTQFLALTSLHVAEFDDFLPDFGPAWERYHRCHTLDGAVGWGLVEMPRKKLLLRALTFAQQRYNQLLSSLRVVIEHAHRVIKRLRVGADTLHLHGEWVRATVMLVACGLHHLRVTSPHRAYLTHPPGKLSNQSE